jgi:hypothetical protein
LLDPRGIEVSPKAVQIALRARAFTLRGASIS